MLEQGAVLGALEPLEPAVDAPPARRDEIDEEREVVDPGVPLGKQIAFEPLEPADRLIQEAANLGDVSRNREHLLTQAVTDRRADPLRQRALQLCGRSGQSLDLVARARERGLELRRRHPAGGGSRDPSLRAVQSLIVHGQEVTLLVG